MTASSAPGKATFQFKLDKLPVRHDPRTLKFGAYLKQGLAPHHRRSRGLRKSRARAGA
jgi:hypothetical protein